MITFANIVSVLQQHAGRYRWLDVLANQVLELHDPAGAGVQQAGPNAYRAHVGGTALEITGYPETGVARFSLPRQQQAVGGALAGAALGALVMAAAKQKSPEGLLLGLLVGGLRFDSIEALVSYAVERPGFAGPGIPPL